MSNDEPAKSAKSAKSDKRAPLIIGGLAILLIAVATYMNYGNSHHHVGSATDSSVVKLASSGAGQTI